MVGRIGGMTVASHAKVLHHMGAFVLHCFNLQALLVHGIALYSASRTAQVLGHGVRGVLIGLQRRSVGVDPYCMTAASLCTGEGESSKLT